MGTLATGRYARRLGIYEPMFDVLKQSETTLAERLRERGGQLLRSLGKREDECQHLLDRFGLKEPPRRRGDGPARRGSARKAAQNTANGSPPLDEVD